MAQKIGVLGSGVVGRTLAEGFLKHGYEVMLGTRDPSKGEVLKWLATHTGAMAGSFRETAIFGEIVVLSVQGLVVEEVIELAGADHLIGKILIDTTDPLSVDRMYRAGARYSLQGLSVAVFKIVAPLRERRRVSDVEQAPVALSAAGQG